MKTMEQTLHQQATAQDIEIILTNQMLSAHDLKSLEFEQRISALEGGGKDA